jgi:hypothetical protein
MTRGVKNSVTVITKHDPLTPVEGRVALLLERAPDAALPFDSASSADLAELLGSPAATKSRAWQLTQKLIADEPPFEGVFQLHVMEEIIIRALENIFHAIHLDRWLVNVGVSECRFRGPSPYIERLRSIQAATRSQYSIVAPDAASLSITEKVKRRVRNKGVSGLADSLVLGARRFFPNAARYLAALPRAQRTQQRGGCWFYTTAYTFTNIGLAYEPHLPQPLRYLVDSSETGSAPLREHDREFYDIYAWASPSDLPGKSGISELRQKLLHGISAVSLQGDDAVARTALIQSDAFQTYLRRILPLTCFHSRISSKFLDEVTPEVIIVGNAAFEGPLLQLARSRGIPTVLLQHGILGDYYQLMDQPADTLLVRGEFWKEFVAEQMRGRTRVLNVPREKTSTKPSARNGGKILFLTSVEAALTNTHESDLRDILTHLLRVGGSSRRALVVRVHPMETVGYYRNIVEKIAAELNLRADVEYSQGSGLDTILENTAVAVTYSSTVFLDCLRRRIPIVSFDWHDFAYKSLIEQHGVFHFAKSLAELEQLVSDGVAGRLAANFDNERFLAPTSPEELGAFFYSLLGKSSAKA